MVSVLVAFMIFVKILLRARKPLAVLNKTFGAQYSAHTVDRKDTNKCLRLLKNYHMKHLA